MTNRIQRFEDLVAWKKARKLTRKIYAVSRTGDFARDFGLRNQIQRASVSIMANVAEGFESGKPGEFHQFVSIAKASCAEVRCQIYIARDVGYLTNSEFESLLGESEELGRVLGGLRRSIQRRRDNKR